MGNSDFYFYLLVVLALLLLIVAPVQWGANVYFGLKGGIVSCLGLSLVGAFVCLVAYQWARGVGSVTANVNISPTEQFFIFVAAFIVCLLLTTLTNFGIYHLVQYRKTGSLNRLVFYTWLAITIGGPMLYIGVKELMSFLAAREQRHNFIAVQLEVLHHQELPLYLDQLKFVNTSNGRETVVKAASVSKFLLEGGAEKNYAGNPFRNSYGIFDKKVSIPVGTDKFFMSWYSFLEDTYYHDEFSFAYEKFAERKSYDGSGIMGGIDFYIKPEGKVDVLGNYNKYLACYSHVGTKALAQEEKEGKLEALRAQNLPKATKEALAEILDQLGASGVAQKSMEMQEKAFNWLLSVKGEGQISNSWLYDSRHQQYHTSYKWLNTLSKKPLPADITVFLKKEEEGEGVWIHLYVNTEALYQEVEVLTMGNEALPLEFAVMVPDWEKSSLRFLIRSGEQVVDFKAFEVEIKKYPRKTNQP